MRLTLICTDPSVDKFEIFDRYQFVAVRELNMDEYPPVSNNLGILIYENYVVTVHNGAVEAVDQVCLLLYFILWYLEICILFLFFLSLFCGRAAKIDFVR